MGANSNSGYNPKDVEKLRENVKKTNAFLDALKKIGVEMPRLEKVLRRLGGAVNTGTDVAEAAHEASVELEKANQEVLKACKGDELCEAEYMRKWQSRNVHWTLNRKNDKSVVRKSIDKTMARYAPEALCKMFEGCAKELKKQEKAKKK